MTNRAFFRVFLKHKALKALGVDRDALNKVLRSRKIFDEVFSRVKRKAGKFGSGDAVTFLEWLLANWEEILKIIMTVIDLFSRKEKKNAR